KAYILVDFAASFEGWFSSCPLGICQTILELLYLIFLEARHLPYIHRASR
ncbi:hypothetical protein JB92DRAFT_3048264, partial [Gautieria morchelliformis]